MRNLLDYVWAFGELDPDNRIYEGYFYTALELCKAGELNQILSVSSVVEVLGRSRKIVLKLRDAV